MSYQLPLTGLDLPYPDLPGPEMPSIDLLRDLWSYPEVSGAVLCRHAKLIGEAGEDLVDSTLKRLGLMTLTLPDIFPVDRVVLHPARPIKLQIKTATRPGADGSYVFDIFRGYGRSPGGLRRYDATDFDMLALVCLPLNLVIFTAAHRNTHRFRGAEIAALLRNPRRSLARAFAELGLALPPDPVRALSRLSPDADFGPDGNPDLDLDLDLDPSIPPAQEQHP
ncbi:MAG: hypothetical protein ACRCTI_12475 [Beijerinckiaceae bacterium]